MKTSRHSLLGATAAVAALPWDLAMPPKVRGFVRARNRFQDLDTVTLA